MRGVARQDRIEINPEIRWQAVDQGHALPLEIVVRKLGGSMTPETVIEDHPRLTLDGVRGGRTFAADYLAGEAG
jgi:uncharacterized protein (DUF433 family)